MIKILLVEDHKLVRQAWRNLLVEQKDMRISGEAETSSEALDFIKTITPDVILLDINLKKETAATLVPAICNILPHPKIIIVSMHDEHSIVKSMFRLGVKGYITKNASLEELLQGIREVYSGNTYLSYDLRELIAHKALEEEEKTTLTLKEIEIIRLITKGLSNSEIATSINISEKTVEGRKTRIYKKLNIKNTIGLLKYASDKGL